MLDEDHNWAIDIQRLKVNLDEARKHCDPRIMVVVNPGNPTGKAHVASALNHFKSLTVAQESEKA